MFQQAISRVKKTPTHIYFYSHKAKYNGIEKYTNYIYTKTKCMKQIIVMEKRANAKIKVVHIFLSTRFTTIVILDHHTRTLFFVL